MLARQGAGGGSQFVFSFFSKEQNTELVVLVPWTVTPTRIKAKLQRLESVPRTVERTV